MTAKNKDDFLFKLHTELHRIGVENNEDIFADFEEHFRASAEQGYTEEETCAKLGDVKEIARNYVDIESTAINSILANAIEDNRPHVSLKKPGRDVPAASAPIAEEAPQEIITEQPAPIREITPEHIAVEPAPAASTSMPKVNISKPVQTTTQPETTQSAREVTPQHITQEPSPAQSSPIPQSTTSPTSGSTTPQINTNTAPQTEHKTTAQQQPKDTSHMSELPPQTETQKEGFSFADIKGRNLDINIGKLVTQICLDLFIYSWALPALASLIIGFIGAMVIGTGGAAIGIFVAENSPLHFLSRIFLGTGLGSLCVLMSCLGVTMVKGFIHIIKSIVIAHVKALYDL